MLPQRGQIVYLSHHVEKHEVEPGSGLLTIVSNDSLENVYAKFRTSDLNGKLSTLWTLVAIDAGTFDVDVARGSVTEVKIDYNAVRAAPGRVKTMVGCGLAGIFGVGAAVGFLIGFLVAN